MKTEETKLYDFIVANNIATEKEIRLVTDICGYKKVSFMNIIFARTGLRSIEQCLSEGYEDQEHDFIELYDNVDC